MLETAARLVSDPNARWVLGGTALLGLAGGVLGSFALLRRRALLADALAHAALPGVCLAFLGSGSKELPVLLAGAAATGVLGTLAIVAITRSTRVKEDAALALVLSVFFGAGILLLTFVQKVPALDASGLDRFIFGQAATLLPGDLRLIAAVTAGLGAVTWLAFKELKLSVFDPLYAASIGLPVRGLELLLAGMIVLAVVVGLQAVGAVLIVALLVVPPAAARLWTARLGSMTVLAGAIGAVAAGLGAALSAVQVPGPAGAPVALPTGPVIVLAAAAAFVVSLLAAPHRGLVAAAIARARQRRRILAENVLKTLYNLEEWRAPRGVPPGRAGSTLAELQAVRRLPARRLARALARLRRERLVERTAGTEPRWVLTEAGLREARRLVRSHRLWEVYLVERAMVAPDHVHRDAEEAEHVLEPELLAELEQRLGRPAHDVHGRPIPAGEEGQAGRGPAVPPPPGEEAAP